MKPSPERGFGGTLREPVPLLGYVARSAASEVTQKQDAVILQRVDRTGLDPHGGMYARDCRVAMNPIFGGAVAAMATLRGPPRSRRAGGLGSRGIVNMRPKEGACTP